MHRVDLNKLPEYLKKQRWFGGKAFPITNIAVADSALLHAASDRSPRDFVMGLVEVTYAMGRPERYLMLVSPTADGGVEPATDEDDFARLLLSYIIDGA